MESEGMKSGGRPISITGVAWLFIAVGAGTFLYHFPELVRLEKDAFAVELTELIGLVAGIFMLRGQNWARWLALAWITFHIIITAVPPYQMLAVHLIIFAGIAHILLRGEARQYFRGHRAGEL